MQLGETPPGHDALPFDDLDWERSDIRTLLFDKESVEELDGRDGIELETENVRWIHIRGKNQNQLIISVLKYFGIHSLNIEDALDLQALPKLEEHRSYLFCIFNSLDWDQDRNLAGVYPVNIFLTGNTVITIQEENRGSLEAIRHRIKYGGGRIRGNGADYLFYAILDQIVDNYYPIVEIYSKRLSKIENKLKDSESQETFDQIYRLKNEINYIRRRVLPGKEIVITLSKLDIEHLSGSLRVYLRDLYEHCQQMLEDLTNLGNRSTSLIELLISINSFKMNEAMKTLTTIATIFMPLTFITGLYGMNFHHMPELEWKDGYFYVLGIMAAIGLFMTIYMKKKNWL